MCDHTRSKKKEKEEKEESLEESSSDDFDAEEVEEVADKSTQISAAGLKAKGRVMQWQNAFRKTRMLLTGVFFL